MTSSGTLSAARVPRWRMSCASRREVPTRLLTCGASGPMASIAAVAASKFEASSSARRAHPRPSVQVTAAECLNFMAKIHRMPSYPWQ